MEHVATEVHDRTHSTEVCILVRTQPAFIDLALSYIRMLGENSSCMVGKYLDPDPPPIRKGGSGEYSTSSHHGLDVAMDSARR